MISCSVLQVLYCLHIALATSISCTSRLVTKLAIIDVAVSDDDKMNRPRWSLALHTKDVYPRRFVKFYGQQLSDTLDFATTL